MRLVFYVFHPPFGHPKGDITGGTLLIFFWIPASPVHPEPVEGLEGVARLAGRGWTLLSWLFVRPLRPLRRGTLNGLSPAGDCVAIIKSRQHRHTGEGLPARNRGAGIQKIMRK